jgi:TonB family protein
MSGCATRGGFNPNAIANPIPAVKPGVFTVKTVTVAPVPIHEVEPDYPAELRALLNGRALVAFTVRVDGRVTDASIVSADHILFGEAAVAAVLQWHFHPAKLDGRAVDCQMQLPFFFSCLPGQSGSELEGAATDQSPDFPEGVLHPKSDDLGPSDSHAKGSVGLGD